MSLTSNVTDVVDQDRANPDNVYHSPLNGGKESLDQVRLTNTSGYDFMPEVSAEQVQEIDSITQAYVRTIQSTLDPVHSSGIDTTASLNGSTTVVSGSAKVVLSSTVRPIP